MELWAHNIEFAGFDVRFWYDNTKVAISSINTNQPTTNKTEFFKFESEFANSMDMLTVLNNETGLDTSNTFRAAFSFLPNVVPGDHIKEKETDPGGIQVVTGEKVKIGTMSFCQLDETEKLVVQGEDTWFKLLENKSYSPRTGIKINKDYYTYYDEQKCFRFTDMTASDVATLEDIKVYSGEINEEDPGSSTYKEYPLDPEFDKEILKYKIELLEYIDEVDIMVALTDTNSKLKIRKPERDETGELITNESGGLVYEEIPITDMDTEIPYKVRLNELRKRRYNNYFGRHGRRPEKQKKNMR